MEVYQCETGGQQGHEDTETIVTNNGHKVRYVPLGSKLKTFSTRGSVKKSPSREMKEYYRRSFDFDRPITPSEMYTSDYKSLSDSELDKASNIYSSSSMTSEFLDLPRKVSNVLSSTPPTLHRLGHCSGDQDFEHNEENDNQSQEHFVENCVPNIRTMALPKIEFSGVDIVIDALECNERLQQEDDITQNYLDNANYTDDYLTRGSGLWINLGPKDHALLSPRSSNGSICSFRSSNADSAIEMLTPDEEMTEPPISEANMPSVWEENRKQVRERDKDSNLGWDSSDYKLNLENQVFTNPSAAESNATSLWQTSLFSADTNPSHSSQTASSSQSTYTFQPPLQKSYNNEGTCTFQPPSQKSYNNEGRSLTSLPSVVISDFSNKITLEDKGSQTIDQGAACSNPSTPWDNRDGQLPIVNFKRSLSNCSISSNESSTFSIQSDSSQDVEESQDIPLFLKKKQSSWIKIRNIVHWSPFIQQFKRKKYPWIQLAGHQGNFQAGDLPGAILKKYDKKEHSSFKKLMTDILRPYVPEYRGEKAKDGDFYLQLQDLLCEFDEPCVMDIKIGCRTYLEDELSKAREKPTLRKDMYQKMVEVDPTAPTQAEHDQKAITKPRYMQWRDDMSSSSNLGFRIEGIRKSNGAQVKNFKTTKDMNSVKNCLKLYMEENPGIISKYLKRLKAIRCTQEDSGFFNRHEIIGSSLLFVHDKLGNANIWMIDFGKTVPLPDNVNVTHRNKWEEGNHEDGYLIGIDSLIELFEELQNEFSFSDINRVNETQTTECTDNEKKSDKCERTETEGNKCDKGTNNANVGEMSSSNRNTTANTSKTKKDDLFREGRSTSDTKELNPNESTV